ncbi:MAG: DUF5666 domain-containing protein [Dehalococcoidia bacterium]
MPRTFASILDECITALGHGELLEDCVARYPQHADELRTHLLLAQRIAMTPRQQPRPGVQAAAWQEFRAHAEDLREGRVPRFNLNLNLNASWLRPVAIAAALVLAFVLMGGGTLYASEDALPDSPLYRVKLAREEVQVWFTFDETSKAEVLLDQSNERTDEVMEMLRDGKEIPPNVLTAMRDRNARAVRILEDKPSEATLLARAHDQSAVQEDLLLSVWGDIQESAQDEYAEAVATLHNAQLRATYREGSVTPQDVAAGVINISGTAEQTEDGSWLLGGVPVVLDLRSLGDTSIEPGQRVKVIAARGADGTLLALSVNAADTEPELRYTVSGALEEIGDGEVVIGGQRIAITDETLLRLRLQLGGHVEIQVDAEDGHAVASSVDGADGGLAQGEPPPLAFEGTLEEQPQTGGVNNVWVVGGQEFVVTPSTAIDALAGDLTQGARARVEAVEQTGDLLARRVVVLDTRLVEEDIDVEGVFEKGNGETWTISGLEVAPPAGAEEPDPGSLVSLRARKGADRLVAQEIRTTLEPGPDGFVIVRGRIGEIETGEGTWQIGAVSVRTDQQTVLSRPAQVGVRAFVWGSRGEDGELRALYVNVIDSKPQPSPTAQD